MDEGGDLVGDMELNSAMDLLGEAEGVANDIEAKMDLE